MYMFQRKGFEKILCEDTCPWPLSLDPRDRLCKLLRIIRAAVLECSTCIVSAHCRTSYYIHSERTQFLNCNPDSDLPCERMLFGHPTESTIKHQSGIHNMDSETFLMSSVKYIKNKRTFHFEMLEIKNYIILWCYQQPFPLQHLLLSELGFFKLIT